MATREGGDGGGRERENRRGSNSLSKRPSSSSTSTSSTSKSASSSDKKPINSSKPIPNYLKPTISSRLDSSSSSFSSRTTSRRPTAATTTTTRPSTERRRSFDIRDVKMSRATTSLSKPSTSSSTKPGPQRSLSTLSSRSAKPAVTPPLRRSLSSRLPPSTTHTTSLGKPAKKTGSKSVASDSTLDIEACDKDPLDNMIGSQDDQDEVLSLPEISEMPGQEDQLGDPFVISEHHLVQNDDQVEKQEEQQEEGENLVGELQVTGEAIEENADEQNEESAESTEGVVAEEDSASVEEKHVVVELEEDEEEEEDKAVEEVVKVEESPKKHEIITQAGMKKEAHDYNEVIEETASKLMENRTSKVRALAGAFETVISLQDPK